MNQLPTIETDRLILRPFTLADAPDVQRIAGNPDIASTTMSIPHPYEDGIAEGWISKHQDLFDKGENLDLAITLRQSARYIGSTSLRFSQKHQHAELGYLIDPNLWNQGYCTEAAHAMLQHAFATLNLHRVFAHHLLRNPASGRVMQKIGMQREGHLRQHVLKNDIFEDIICYGILKHQYQPTPKD
ncbi:MAG: GNAT family N-acetyltransferase [Sedimentisphaerales bacterium]|nr:GNAT family N-acetyltransferase [Sedimentisphaerales bacterium]